MVLAMAPVLKHLGGLVTYLPATVAVDPDLQLDFGSGNCARQVRDMVQQPVRHFRLRCGKYCSILTSRKSGQSKIDERKPDFTVGGG